MQDFREYHPHLQLNDALVSNPPLASWQDNLKLVATHEVSACRRGAPDAQLVQKEVRRNVHLTAKNQGKPESARYQGHLDGLIQ